MRDSFKLITHDLNFENRYCIYNKLNACSGYMHSLCRWKSSDFQKSAQFEKGNPIFDAAFKLQLLNNYSQIRCNIFSVSFNVFIFDFMRTFHFLELCVTATDHQHSKRLFFLWICWNKGFRNRFNGDFAKECMKFNKLKIHLRKTPIWIFGII